MNSNQSFDGSSDYNPHNNIGFIDFSIPSIVITVILLLRIPRPLLVTKFGPKFIPPRPRVEFSAIRFRRVIIIVRLGRKIGAIRLTDIIPETQSEIRARNQSSFTSHRPFRPIGTHFQTNNKNTTHAQHSPRKFGIQLRLHQKEHIRNGPPDVHLPRRILAGRDRQPHDVVRHHRQLHPFVQVQNPLQTLLRRVRRPPPGQTENGPHHFAHEENDEGGDDRGSEEGPERSPPPPAAASDAAVVAISQGGGPEGGVGQFVVVDGAPHEDEEEEGDGDARDGGEEFEAALLVDGGGGFGDGLGFLSFLRGCVAMHYTICNMQYRE